MEAELEVVRDAFDAFTHQDFDRWFSRLHPNVEWISDDLTGPRTYHGHAGVRQWAGDVFDDLRDVQLEILELLPARDRVFVAFAIHARGRTSGISGTVRRAALAAVDNGMLTYYRSYVDEDEARAAAGLVA